MILLYNNLQTDNVIFKGRTCCTGDIIYKVKGKNPNLLEKAAFPVPDRPLLSLRASPRAIQIDKANGHKPTLGVGAESRPGKEAWGRGRWL
jgi:hypothetical protein